MNLKINFLVASFALTFSTMYGQTTTLESKAKEWIAKNPNKVGMASKDNFELKSSRKSLSGETLRFQQEIKGIPVYEGDIAIHFNRKEEITYTSEIAAQKINQNISTIPLISADEAFKKALKEADVKGEITNQENGLFIFLTDSGETKLVHRILVKSYETKGSWEVMIDAHTGETIIARDIAIYNKHSHDKDKKKKSKGSTNINSDKALKATGTAYIYEPNPINKMQVTYSGQYVDGSDATNASLDAARTLVTIPELELSGGLYRLKSKYVAIKEIESPNKGLFSQASNNFLFNRFDDGFEAVNVFHHLNQSLIYINETLGIPCIPSRNNGVLSFDPHGAGGDDQSYYDPSAQELVFGEGGVDDGEDAHVILHELGHGIHAWMVGGNASSRQGLGEGSGDYWAMSYSRSLNQWPSSRPEYNWVFSWDGHNPFWAGRVTNYATKYTSNISNTANIHRDGQIWSTCLMRIYDRIGKEKTDRIFLEGLGMTNSTTNQQGAAIAVRQAAIDMVGTHGFTCDDVAIISQEMATTGYTLPTYQCTLLAVADVNKNSATVYPNPAKDNLTVSMDFKKTETAEIYSLDGRKISESNINSNNNVINVSRLNKGIYLLKIKGTDIVQKFIKD